MVGVAPRAEEDELSTKSPVVKYLLKVRENHARDQRKDYSHVFRPKTRLELLRLSAIAMAVEFAYAAETSFVSPILLQIGIDHKHMTMAWGLSPLIGFFMSPLLGSVSDRCKLSWGRRRPIITLLSFGIVLGLILVPYGKDFGILLGDGGHKNITTIVNDNNRSSIESSNHVVNLITSREVTRGVWDFKYAVILTIIGMVLLDLNADTCQTPARTYLLDMCTSKDQPRALTTFTLMAGIGGTIGYAIGGIDWDSTQIGTFLGGNIPTVFGLVTIIFIVCYLVTVTTFREIPLKLIEKDEMLRPLSPEVIKMEMRKQNDTLFYIKETTILELKMAENETTEGVELQDYTNGISPPSTDPQLTQTNGTVESAEPRDDGPVTLKEYLKSIFVMPPSLRILSLTNLLCWMGHVTYCLYFTDFVGETVFHGDPTAPPLSEQAELYNAGVRFGCFGMSIYAFSCSVYSMAANRLFRLFGIKTVYITGIAYYGIGMLILAIWPTKWGVLLFSTSAGILYGTLFTVPYILVANYHAKNCFRLRDGETVPLKQQRGLGTDVAIISSVVFIAQLVVALSVGPLITWLGTTAAILYASTFFAALAAIAAIFVLYI